MKGMEAQDAMEQSAQPEEVANAARLFFSKSPAC